MNDILRAVDLGIIIQQNNERLFWQCQEYWWEEYSGQNDAEIIETLTEQFCAWDEIKGMGGFSEDRGNEDDDEFFRELRNDDYT
jgi:hypothetical protein